MKKKNLLCILVFCFNSICPMLPEENSVRREKLQRESAVQMQEFITGVQRKKEAAIQNYLGKLPYEQKVAQLFLVNIEGNRQFVPVERTGELYGESKKGSFMVPGGCLFFSYNIADTPEEIMTFIDSITEYSNRHGLVPPFLAVDQEGGTVNRLKGITGPLPSCERVAACLDIERAYRLYLLQGRQMKALGFHLNLAPVAEVQTDSNAEFLAGRSFGDRQSVIGYGRAAINGYKNSGIGCVLKHFPGNTNTDPHSGLPEINWSDDELEKNSLMPFTILVSENPVGVLMSHARTSAHDAEIPACLSKYWVDYVLRQQMSFGGIVFSDDIFMNALQKNGFPPDTAAVMAIEAGVDCIMLSEKRFAGIAHIIIRKSENDPVFAAAVEKSVERIIRWKLQQGILDLSCDKDGSWHINASGPAPVSERLKQFSQSRQENIRLYQENF